ncbi:BrnA antitoxin family protein [Conservatibacter flavescens]|uniref:Toxin-antitoxin system, antitoxin component n=1 Tax=Conservatibacter flavescens TaxID=28161 RepID=A0A2M8S5T3_9PAST|nr:BrnA antitoxin family protein [Conservatibacter flavescens]PJG86525.1 toxin-antitoxin system, antitoxin component [Conservatibacter flavescens]
MSRPLTNEAGEVRELTAEDFANFKPIAEVMSPEFMAMVTTHMENRKGRGKQKKPTKELVSIRLSADVLKSFRATGKGWQNRIDQVLLEYVSNQ